MPLGPAFIYISGMSSGGKKWGTHQLVYIAEGLDQLILSKEACQSMGIIKEDFLANGIYGSADIKLSTTSPPVMGVQIVVNPVATRRRRNCSHCAVHGQMAPSPAQGRRQHHRHQHTHRGCQQPSSKT